MLLWMGFAVLTAAVVTALMLPLRRGSGASREPEAAGLAIYRSQLLELESERERGLITEDEVQGARAEVARRLIKGADALGYNLGDARPNANRRAHRPRSVLVAVVVLIPVLSVGAYLELGTPGLPGRPFALREETPVADTSVAELISRVEARLREHPEDGEGWDVVAPVYIRLGRYGDAVHAYGQARRILGETTKRLIGFAEASLLANDGVVSEEVRRTAERILVLEPGRPEARIWLALAKEQDGDLRGAATAYRALIESAPADALWREPVADRLTLLNKRLSGEAPGVPGSSADDVARARETSAGERAEVIAQMVDGLAARLKQDGKDLAGWLELVRAYKVLGRDGEAVAALGEARRNFNGDQKSLDEIDELAKGLGLGS